MMKENNFMNASQIPEKEVLLARLGAAIPKGEGYSGVLPPTVDDFAKTIEKVYDDPRTQALIKDFDAGLITSQQFDTQIQEIFGEQ